MSNSSPPPMQDYALPKGHPDLMSALLEDFAHRHPNQNITGDDLQITAGASHGLLGICNTLCDPGQEIIVLSPHWLFITGIIETAGAVPVQTPFFDRLTGNPKDDFEKLVSPKLSSKTAAIYLNYPNNPTGVPMTRAYLEALVDFAKSNDIYIIGDYAYMDYDFSEEGFIDLADNFDCSERLVSCYSLSKCYGVAGYRVGYVVSHIDGFMDSMLWTSIHSVYSASTPGQIACSKLIEHYGSVSPFREKCGTAIEMFNTILPDLRVKPQGGYYGFIPTQLNGVPCSYDSFIEEGLKKGVTVSPGAAFGSDYENWARVSLVGVEAPQLETGLQRLKELMF